MSNNFIQIFKKAFNKENPIIVQVLGICSALAISVKLEPAIVMTFSVIIVLAFSNFFISLLRNFIPNRIRIIVQLIVVAMFVILVDLILKAFLFQTSKQLSVFVGLIITNCILMGRLEAFALKNKPIPSFIDGLANGFAYGIILIIVSFFRELFGAGRILDFKVIPDYIYDIGYMNNGLMLLPSMALFIIGIIIFIHRFFNKGKL